jgi:RNA polymerase sigma-70 factor (ECF subfamily)
MKETTGTIDVEAYYRQFAPMVYRRCLFLLKSEEAALDIMQDVFVQVLRFRDRLQHQGPSSLLYTIATRLSLNALRKKRWEALPDEIASRDRTEDLVLGKLLLDRIFRTEKPDTRVIAVYYFVDGMTLEETAKMAGLSVSGVRKRLKKLQDQARRLTGEEHSHGPT